MNGITIIVPTYNGEKVIEMALEGIFKQSTQIPIEVIIVNNNSTDGTTLKAENYWSSNKRNNIDFKILNENNPGKFNAQHLGIISANYNTVVICDDDNILDEDYCQTAFEWLKKNHDIGAIGGCGRPLFGACEPSWFQTYQKFYAVGPQGDRTGNITNLKGSLYGAGMVIRKDIYVELFNKGFEPLFTSRNGKQLASGSEDTELCYAFRLMGYKIFYDSNLTFKHFIDKRKLTKEYLNRLVLSQAIASGNDLVYKNLIYQKSFLIFWIDNFKSISTLEFYKNLAFFLTNYKKMRLHSIYYFISFFVLLRVRFLLLRPKLKSTIEVFS
jgi:glycosyltransferase involved in cell wall biosynthesis